jgi:hypothetical protein
VFGASDESPRLRLEVSARHCSDRVMPEMMTYAEIESFFTGLVAEAQSRGITCAITSGMACVHFGVSTTTKDCDVLCAAESAERFLELIAATRVRDIAPTYRGNLSPPLDARWLRGGWTAHVVWKAPPDEVCLDVFGVAPRGSTPWEEKVVGFYVNPHVVAEMKRTNREKDWPFATALGGQMLEGAELRGWLHLHALEVLRRFAASAPIPPALVEVRPLLRLAPFSDTLRMKRLLAAERAFWSELDELRIGIYQRHLRPYTSAVRRAQGGRNSEFRASHAIRLACATEHLPRNPLRDYGIERMLAEVRATVAVTVGPDVVEWLPAAGGNFHGLAS